MTPLLLLPLLLLLLAVAPVHSSPYPLPLTDTTIQEAAQLWTSNDATNQQTIEMLYGRIEDWDVSQVTSMNRLFRNALGFDADLSKWDVSQVTDMELMFYGASSFTHDLSQWNVSQVQNLAGMFVHASSYNVSLCWPTLGEFVFLEDIFCATNGAKFDPCCNIPLYYVRASCCTKDDCDVFCATAPSSSPTTTPTGEPTQQPTTAPTPAPTKTQHINITSHITLVGQSVNLTKEEAWVEELLEETLQLDNGTVEAPMMQDDDDEQNYAVSVQIEQGKQNNPTSNSNSTEGGWNKRGFAITIVALAVCAAVVALVIQRKRRQDVEDDLKQSQLGVSYMDDSESDESNSVLDREEYPGDEESPEMVLLPVCSEPPISIDHYQPSALDRSGEAVELSFDESYLNNWEQQQEPPPPKEVHFHDDDVPAPGTWAAAVDRNDKYQMQNLVADGSHSLLDDDDGSVEGLYVSKVILEDVRKTRLN